MSIPLAERMRPKNLEQFIGQGHLLGPNGILNPIIKNGNLHSMILWGPPGTGKTTLAKLLASEKERAFYQLSAINSGVKEIREILQKAENTGSLLINKNPYNLNFGMPSPIRDVEEWCDVVCGVVWSGVLWRGLWCCVVWCLGVRGVYCVCGMWWRGAV